MAHIRTWLHRLDKWIISFGTSAIDISDSYNACI